MRPDWFPIDTAPKDGAILLCKAPFQPVIGRWVPLREMIEGTLYEQTPLGEKEGVWCPYDWDGEFEDDEALLSYCNAGSYEPTHWAALPEPPDA